MQYDNQFPTDLNLDIVEPMGCTDCGGACSDGCQWICSYGCGNACSDAACRSRCSGTNNL